MNLYSILYLIGLLALSYLQLYLIKISLRKNVHPGIKSGVFRYLLNFRLMKPDTGTVKIELPHTAESDFFCINMLIRT